jgi:hypothetical protein
MNDIIKKYVNKEKNQEIIVYQDSDIGSPREWDNVTIMSCFHNNYNLPNETEIETSDFNNWDEMERYILETYDIECILPVSMTDHSGLSFYTGVLNGWDSGQVGFIFMTKEQRKERGSFVDPKEILEGQIKQYDQWSNGDIYAFKLIQFKTCGCCNHTSEDLIDSCCGYYGYNEIENNLKDFTDMTGFVEE